MASPVMRSATPLRKALESVLATARRSMSMACTCSAPLRASSMASIPVPQPMSRQRLPSPMWFWKRYFHTRKLPWVGTKTPGSHPSSGISSGYRRRPRSSVHGRSDGSADSPRSIVPLAAPLTASATARDPGGMSRTRARAPATCSGRVPQQPPMIWAPSWRQTAAILAVLLAVDGLVEAPAVVGVIPEVGIDAERQVG
jgi:hypothetical protein